MDKGFLKCSMCFCDKKRHSAHQLQTIKAHSYVPTLLGMCLLFFPKHIYTNDFYNDFNQHYDKPWNA